MTARWRLGRIGLELAIDGESAVTVAKNGREWRAWGDVQYGNTSRSRVIAYVEGACRDAGIEVTNQAPEE